MDPQSAGAAMYPGVGRATPGHHPVAHSRHHDQAAAALALADAERAQDDARRLLESRRELAYLLGRLFVGALFLLTAIAKVLHFGDTVVALRETGMVDAHVLLPAAIAVEATGALFLLAGYKVRRVALGLVVYLVTVTFLISFDLTNSVNADSALSNLGFAGALLMLAAHGAGRGSADAALERRSAQRYEA